MKNFKPIVATKRFTFVRGSKTLVPIKRRNILIVRYQFSILLVKTKGKEYPIAKESLSIIGLHTIYSTPLTRQEAEAHLQKLKDDYADQNIITSYRNHIDNLPKTWESRTYTSRRTRESDYWCSVKPGVKVAGYIEDDQFFITKIYN